MNSETAAARRRRRRNVDPPSMAEIIDVESFRSDKGKVSDIIYLSDGEDDDDVRILNFVPENTPFGKRKRNNIEKGESSKSKTPFVCEICTDTKTLNEAFYIGGCSHFYCSDCVVMYIGSKLSDNIVNIRCPVSGCSGLLEPEFCRSILPADVFDRWGNALSEALIDVSEKFYCPFADCSALLIQDGSEVVRQSECPNCKRMFCAQCKVAWHEGIECSEFETLNADERGKDDVMLMRLAKDNQWRRCPNCKFYVARTMGCNHMRCRCGCSFCYQCGGAYSGPGGLCICFQSNQRNQILPHQLMALRNRIRPPQQPGLGNPMQLPQQPGFGNPMQLPQQPGFGNPMQLPQQPGFGNPMQLPQQQQLGFGNPMHFPQQLGFGNPIQPPQQLGFGNPIQPSQQLRFGNPIHPPQQLGFGNPMQFPQLGLGNPIPPPQQLGLGNPTHLPPEVDLGNHLFHLRQQLELGLRNTNHTSSSTTSQPSSSTTSHPSSTIGIDTSYT